MKPKCLFENDQVSSDVRRVPNPNGAPVIYADSPAERRSYLLSDAEHARLAALDPKGKGNASRGLRALIAGRGPW